MDFQDRLFSAGDDGSGSDCETTEALRRITRERQDAFQAGYLTGAAMAAVVAVGMMIATDAHVRGIGIGEAIQRIVGSINQ